MYWDLFVSLPAFAIAVAGVFAAYVALKGWVAWWTVAAVLIAIFALGKLADWLAGAVLYRRPRVAVWLFDFSACAPAAIAVLASAFLLFNTIRVEELDLKGADSELAKAFFTGLAAYVTATFLEAAKDMDQKWIAPRVKTAFQAHFRGKQHYDAAKTRIYYFDPGRGPVESWVHSDPAHGVEGWTATSRHRRAKAIADLLPGNPSWQPPAPLPPPLPTPPAAP